MLPDNELLRRYCQEESETAFTELVQRHLTLVYGAALSQLNADADRARDVTQVVFADLARKAGSLLNYRSMAGWLYTSARFAAAKLVRSEQRRRNREQHAIEMNNQRTIAEPDPDPESLRPLIEEAMQELEPDDSEAVLLRYFEGHDFKRVGHCLGTSEEAARKRVTRAVARLRGALETRGISSSDSALAKALSGAAAVAVPADLHAGIISAVLADAAVATSPIVPTLWQAGAAKPALLIGGLAVLVGTAWLWQRSSSAELQRQNVRLQEQIASLPKIGATQPPPDDPESIKEELARLRREHAELLKLRDEVTRLRADQRQAAAPKVVNDPVRPEPMLAQLTIEAKFLKGPASILRKTSMDAVGLDLTGVGVTGILTESQFRKLLQAFEQETAMDILAAPRVTTLHNRAASIQVAPTVDAGDSEVKLGPHRSFFRRSALIAAKSL
jgi:RNA polymerase sigma factor (sigma-70 family)